MIAPAFEPRFSNGGIDDPRFSAPGRDGRIGDARRRDPRRRRGAWRPPSSRRAATSTSTPSSATARTRTGRSWPSACARSGLEVRHPVAKTGVVGDPARRPARRQWWRVRADMDALPIQERNDVPYKSQNAGVKHACGHDAHTTIVLGAAEVLAKMKDRLPGTVVFLFQPAEEGPPEGEEGGAPLMLKEGVLDDPKVQAIYGLHMDPDAADRRRRAGPIGPIYASSDTFAIEVAGQDDPRRVPAHRPRPDPGGGGDGPGPAARSPRGRSTPSSPKVLTIGQIQGGIRYNIIADQVTLRRHHAHARRRRCAREMKDRIARTVTGRGRDATARPRRCASSATATPRPERRGAHARVACPACSASTARRTPAR